MKAAILTDVTKCIGCQACVCACKEANDLPRDDGGKELSATTWTCVEQHHGVNVRRQCMHCADPSCVSVCPVGALEKTAEGPVIYHQDRCIGCRYCMVACPFSIPKYEWDKAVPGVRKCIMCFENAVSQGKQPACTSVCPTGATIFGSRSKLLAQAKQRIQAATKRYVDHVYGEHEAGGTSVMYLAALPFAQLGFRTGVLQSPYPKLTWSILSKLPQVVTISGVALTGIWWIIRRRQALAQSAEGGNDDE